MRVLTGYTPPTHGDAIVAGYNIVSHSLDARRHIGYLPETVPLYLDMTVTDYLEYMGRLRGMNKGWVSERVPKVIDTVRLGAIATPWSASSRKVSGSEPASRRRSFTSLTC